jgi:Cdc6-like AAA superfamily ATPase
MWTDIEPKTDLLNFGVVADTAAQLIRDAGGQPLSIGVSGNWGVGKSSLVKMVGESLKSSSDAQGKYISSILMLGYIRGLTMRAWHCCRWFRINCIADGREDGVFSQLPLAA